MSCEILLQVVKVEEEEWSYIPVGGPLPKTGQTITAFGAAANLVHFQWTLPKPTQNMPRSP